MVRVQVCALNCNTGLLHAGIGWLRCHKQESRRFMRKQQALHVMGATKSPAYTGVYIAANSIVAAALRWHPQKCVGLRRMNPMSTYSAAIQES